MRKFYLFVLTLFLIPSKMHAQSCSDASNPATAVLNLAGLNSVDDLDDPSNVSGVLNAGTAGDVVAIEVSNVDLSTFGTSWCSEATIEIIGIGGVSYSPSTQDAGDPCNDLPANGFFDLNDLGLIFPTQGNGNVDYQLYESFDDVNNSVDAQYTSGTITIYVCPTGSVLPVELLDFYGKLVQNRIQLNWQTATELNNDYMAVERSADGRSFHEIGRVNGAGTTYEAQEYTFIDERPLPGVNYYRLRQVDYDGVFEIHPTIAITYRDSEGKLQVGAYPNPAADVLHVRWTGLEEGDTQLRVFDLNGRQLLRYRTDGNSAGYDLPLTTLPAGMYVLQLTAKDQTEVMRFEKQ